MDLRRMCTPLVACLVREHEPNDRRTSDAQSLAGGDDLGADQADHLDIGVVEVLEEDALDAGRAGSAQTRDDLVDGTDELVLLG